jgi:hypothetical protein
MKYEKDKGSFRKYEKVYDLQILTRMPSVVMNNIFSDIILLYAEDFEQDLMYLTHNVLKPNLESCLISRIGPQLLL